MKADSEGQAGPSSYHRTHADAANVVAKALAPHHGIIFYRGFVYDHHMDWNNPKNDRARAAYDNFVDLDGKFDANVVIQIKNGPIDFQVREPASPLFAVLDKTQKAIELQITQEYMGQSRHMVFLVPQWKEALDFTPAWRELSLQRGFKTSVQRLRRCRERRPRRQLVRQSSLASQPLRLRPLSLEPRSHVPPNHRRMDSPRPSAPIPSTPSRKCSSRHGERTRITPAR